LNVPLFLGKSMLTIEAICEAVGDEYENGNLESLKNCILENIQAHIIPVGFSAEIESADMPCEVEDIKNVSVIGLSSQSIDFENASFDDNLLAFTTQLTVQVSAEIAVKATQKMDKDVYISHTTTHGYEGNVNINVSLSLRISLDEDEDEDSLDPIVDEVELEDLKILTEDIVLTLEYLDYGSLIDNGEDFWFGEDTNS